MKNDKDINNSLSNIKKALREEGNISENNKGDNDFFLLEDVVEKKVLDKKLTKKASVIKKNKARKEKVELVKKTIKKKKPVEIVINKEIKPIIQKWIRKNLRSFVKKVVVEEFKVISKAAFKQNSANK